MKQPYTPTVNRLLHLTPLLVFFLFVGCGKKHTTQAPAAELPIAQVQVQPTESGERARTDHAVGTLRARQRAVLEARVPGRIAEITVGLGQPVQAGELLVRLDAAEFKARLTQAEAALEQASREYKRVSKLLEGQAATRAEADAAEARLRGAEASVAEARTMLGYVEIHAPFAGVITRKSANVGDFAASGKSLLEMENPSELRLEADVPESSGGNLKPGMELTVVLGEKQLAGKVSEIAPTADVSSRTFLVKVDLPRIPWAKSGQFARLLIPSGSISSLRVPAVAVLHRGQLEIAFVVVDNVARMRLVKTGSRVGDQYEILAGLDAGDRVVVNGIANLVDGQKVEVR